MTSPAPKFLLSGNHQKYLYHNCTLALDAQTGKIVWYYQHVVDHWDLDHTFERMLIDTEVAPAKDAVAWINPAIKPGTKYKVLTGVPGKTGIVYTLDRRTGQFLWARPTSGFPRTAPDCVRTRSVRNTMGAHGARREARPDREMTSRCSSA